MATKKKVVKRTTEEFEEPDEALPFGDPVPIDSDDDSIKHVVQRLGGDDVQVEIHKIVPHGFSYCWTAPGDFSYEQLRDNYGGGRFRCRVYKNGELRQTVVISIENPISAVPVVGHQATEGAQVRMFEQQLGFMKELVLKQDKTPVLEMVQAIMALRGESQAPAMNPADLMNMFLKGLEFARENIGASVKEPEDWKTKAFEILGQIAPAFMGPGPQRQALPETTEGGNPGMDKNGLMLRAALAYLKKKALAGSDPELYIALVADNSDEPQYQVLLRWILSASWADVVAVDSELGGPPFESFFKTIYDGLRQGFEATHPVVSHTSGGGGNGADVGGHAEVGKKRGKPS
jgi:hypothetical protein